MKTLLAMHARLLGARIGQHMASRGWPSRACMHGGARYKCCPQVCNKEAPQDQSPNSNGNAESTLNLHRKGPRIVGRKIYADLQRLFIQSMKYF